LKFLDFDFSENGVVKIFWGVLLTWKTPWKLLWYTCDMGWSGGLAEWTEGDTAYVSAVFSWNVEKAYMRCVWLKSAGYYVKCGGQAVAMNPRVFSEFDTSGMVDALPHHNQDAVFTSRGCIRRCSFCLVPKLEGALVELDEWDTKPIICDNNLLACSTQHFDRVIDKLLDARMAGIDFNQGLDARLLTDYHAKRLAELPKDTIVRLAWDSVATEPLYLSSFQKLVDAGVGKNQIRTYVLIGYKDTPEDARYRLEKIVALGALPNPMRYQPLDAKRRNGYVGEGWSESQLSDYMRYWSKLRYFGGFTFDDYKKIKNGQEQDGQLVLPNMD